MSQMQYTHGAIPIRQERVGMWRVQREAHTQRTKTAERVSRAILTQSSCNTRARQQRSIGNSQ